VQPIISLFLSFLVEKKGRALGVIIKKQIANATSIDQNFNDFAEGYRMFSKMILGNAMYKHQNGACLTQAGILSLTSPSANGSAQVYLHKANRMNNTG